MAAGVFINGRAEKAKAGKVNELALEQVWSKDRVKDGKARTDRAFAYMDVLKAENVVGPSITEAGGFYEHQVITANNLTP